MRYRSGEPVRVGQAIWRHGGYLAAGREGGEAGKDRGVESPVLMTVVGEWKLVGRWMDR